MLLLGGLYVSQSTTHSTATQHLHHYYPTTSPLSSTSTNITHMIFPSPPPVTDTFLFPTTSSPLPSEREQFYKMIAYSEGMVLLLLVMGLSFTDLDTPPSKRQTAARSTSSPAVRRKRTRVSEEEGQQTPSKVMRMCQELSQTTEFMTC